MKDKITKELKDLFDDLEMNAYNRDYHTYYYKDANQIIRKHFERLQKQVKVEPEVKPATCGHCIDCKYYTDRDCYNEKVEDVLIISNPEKFGCTYFESKLSV